MRLINVKSEKFSEFSNPIPHKYAVVSHCWNHATADSEVRHKEYHASLSPQDEQKAKWKKVQMARRIASDHGLEWFWLDTCCIDHSSSAEVEEAINSMYDWYDGSNECYVFMPDVKVGEDDLFKRSKWFTRGWTLQELLAPQSVIFYDQDYQMIGTRTARKTLISEATGIDPEYLKPVKNIQGASIAQRMSWAVNRKTTKVEDRAYSLLGIFGVNMPMLYGEGHRAFLRLQLAILKQSDDESIFAWRPDPKDTTFEDETCGMLAENPDVFIGRGLVRPTIRKTHEPYVFTNRGLRLKVPKKWLDRPSYFQSVNFQSIEIKVELDCEEPSSTDAAPSRLAITLRRYNRTGLWYRSNCEHHNRTSKWMAKFVGYATIYVPQPKLGQVRLQPLDDRALHAASATRELLFSLVTRELLIFGGLWAHSYAHGLCALSYNKHMAEAALFLCFWSVWTMLWVSLGRSGLLLFEMLGNGLLLLMASCWPE